MKGPFMLLNYHSDQRDQTQTIAEGYTEYTGSDGGSRKAADAERSTGLPKEPSFSSSESTAGGQVPHPAQKDSCPSSTHDQWEVLRNPFCLPESAIVVRLLQFLKVCVPSLPKLRWGSCSSLSSKTCRRGFYWLCPRPGLWGKLSFLSRDPIVRKNLWKKNKHLLFNWRRHWSWKTSPLWASMSESSLRPHPSSQSASVGPPLCPSLLSDHVPNSWGVCFLREIPRWRWHGRTRHEL